MIGLALSGGGVKGSYEVGAYMALKKCHIKPSVICGTSIGAFNGAMIASHREKELLSFWRNAKFGNILGFSEEYVNKVNNKDFDIDFYKLSYNTLTKILKNKGIDSEEMLNTLKSFNIESRLRKSDINFGLCTYRLNDKSKIQLFINDIPENKLDDYILASCFLPVFQKRKLVDDGYYFDGGIYNNLPINMLLEAGCDKIYAIDLKAIGIKQKVAKEANVTYISPSRRTSSIISVDKEKINNNLLLGYLDTLKVLNKLDGKTYFFKKYNEKFYDFLVRKINLDELNRAKKLMHVNTNKDLVIKCLENLMKKNELDYLKIYNPIKIIKYFRKHKENTLSLEIIQKIKFVF